MMSKDDGKISAFDFEQAVMSTRKADGEIEWNGLSIKIRSTVNFEHMFMFVEYVVKSCFDSDTGEYLPQMKDFATKSAILKYYTNISLPDSSEKQFKLLYGTDLFERVFDSQIIDMDQLNSMNSSINAKLKQLSDSDVVQLHAEFEMLLSNIENLVNQFSSIFDGIDNELLDKIATAAIDGGFDEAKLAKAFLGINQENELDTEIKQFTTE